MGIGIAVIAIVVYIIAWLTAGSDVASMDTDTDTPAPQSVFAESEESFSMGSSEMQNEEAAGAGAESEGLGADADNALLYGAYVYDGAVSWSEDPEENFELDME